MGLLRSHLWLWVIIASLFACVVISIIFIAINKCISRQGKHRIAYLQRTISDFTIKENKYQQRSPQASTPPLPPRTQFLTEAAQSYENLAAVSEYELAMPTYEQDIHDYEEATPEYEQATAEYEQAMPTYEQDMHDYEEATPEYEQATPEYEEATPDYEQEKAEQFDYVKVEAAVQILPPTCMGRDPSAYDSTNEDYDDIGGGDQSEEDYDDLG